MPPDLPSSKAGITHVTTFSDPHVLYMVCRKLNALTRRGEYLLLRMDELLITCKVQTHILRAGLVI